MSGTHPGIPVPHPDRVIDEARQDSIGALMDAVELGCLELRKLEARLREAGLDLEAGRAGDIRRVLRLRVTACHATTGRLAVQDGDG